jgi:hypothetical protein
MSPTAGAKSRGGETQSEGMDNTNYVFMAAGAAVIAGITIYIVTKGKDDNQQAEQEEGVEESEDSQSGTLIESELTSISESKQIETASVDMPAFTPFVGIDHEQTVTVGVSFSF